MAEQQHKTLKQFFSSHRPLLSHILVRVKIIGIPILVALSLAVTLSLGYWLFLAGKHVDFLQKQLATITIERDATKKELETTMLEDQRVKNRTLQTEINALKEAFRSAVDLYGSLLDFHARSSKTAQQDSLFATLLSLLAKDNLPEAKKVAEQLSASIKTETQKLAAAAVIPANVPEIAEAPSSGYRRQKVTVNGASFLVDIVAADMNSTRVIVDTASSSTCANDCPALPLADYVARSGAYAGVNGSYFCPDSYPQCADKKNSFDTLLMNKDKVYFNSDNNVYSTVPLVVSLGSSLRFVSQSLEWGRDTGVDMVIANRPLLVSGGNIAFSGEGEPKEGSKGNRSFIGGQGNMAYIGVVRSASVAESAKVIHAMGIQNALNLDDGGSTALWSGGYKVGPGRNLPNVVLFVRK